MGIITERTYSSKSHKNYKFMIEKYNSAMDVYEDCKSRPMTSSSFHDKSKENMDKSWEGVKNYEEALGYLRNGYQPTVDKMKEQIKFTVKGNGKRISFQNDIVGAVPVVPLAMMGIPNNMINMKMKPIKCKVLDIYYDMTCSWGTEPSEIIENGQKLLGAIIELEKQGYRFNLYGVQSYSNSDSCDMLVVKIKSSSQPIDLKRISFPLTHAAYFRVIGFDWYSKTPKGTYRSGYGHGFGYEFKGEERREMIQKALGQNVIYIAGSEIMSKGEDEIKEALLENERKN